MFETRCSAGELRFEERADGPPVLAGYAATFGAYSQNLGGFVEQIDPRAFSNTLGRGGRVLAVFNHDENQLLGATDAGTLRLEADDIGLRYEIDLNMSDPDAQRVAAKVARGDLRGSSFKFRPDKDGDEWGETEQGYPLRTLKSVALFDVGPVTSPAYLGTAVGDAAVALRSLAATTGRDLDELVAAAKANELRTILDDPDPDPEPASRPLGWEFEVDELQRRFDALRSSPARPLHL